MSTPYQPSEEIAALIGKQIVVDTDSSYIYIGTLEKAGPDYLTLLNVDVHDCNESRSTKEHYAHEALAVGARANRNQTILRLARVLSISKMDDVVKF
jgi:small nuclear ribonucleoprotein (snRNP)-like protein